MLVGHPAVAQNEMQIARAPEALSASFAEIARRVEPAVVNIDTKSAVPEIAERGGGDKENDSTSNSLLDLFRRQARRPAKGVGSGFIVDQKGYILTNKHVVDEQARIVIRLQSGEEYVGSVVGVDAETDLAVVKINATKPLPIVKLGDSSATQVGDWVLAIGSPFGLDQTVTAGIISTRERNNPAFFSNFQQFLQTDAAINRGNSGGPLVNMKGEVIGVNSQIATSTGDYNGIGFALPANEASFVYQQILTNGKVRRGYLGVVLESVKPESAKVFGLAEVKGVIVADVREAQGPAAKAGIQPNDIIIEFNGQQVGTAQDLISRVASTAVGSNATMVYLRDINGTLERRTATLTIGERPPPNASIAEPEPSTPKVKENPKSNGLRLGLVLAELTPQGIDERNLGGVRGLLVKEVDPNGIAADARPYPVNEGEVITRINRIPVTSRDEFSRVVDALKPGDPIVLNISYSNPRTKRIEQRIVQFTYQ
jgi:serine protease Do